MPFHLNNGEAVFAIQCGDGVEVTDTLEELRAFYETAAKTSQFVEFLVGSNRVSCPGWQVYRDDRFKGPVAGANMSFPLLLLTTSADPVAPTAAALKTLAGFPGSAILTQDSPGHTSMTAPSICTSTYFPQYFQNGTLPDLGTVCPRRGDAFRRSCELHGESLRCSEYERGEAACGAQGHWRCGAPILKCFTHSQPSFLFIISRYKPSHLAWAARRFAVFAYDLRGFGRTSLDKTYNSAYGQMGTPMADLEWAIKHTSSLFPGNLLFLMGHSMAISHDLSVGESWKVDPWIREYGTFYSLYDMLKTGIFLDKEGHKSKPKTLCSCCFTEQPKM
ncbi:Alpha beta hydrolase fold family [Mycena venus]|uniref:Alpha beta hydrolase fold family n=1 Tax=Mycena venus TaxID=2733690 RepID=A0A8H6XHE0_9AGAR|nr:Alpha beta hydrolase fold family [Mycena venus]